MGNRGVITTEDKEIAIYLHWCGGRDTVSAFLAYCRAKGYRCPETDCYGWARLCQVICNSFGGTLSVGVYTFQNLGSQGDNGVYIIKEWKIIGREDYDYPEQKENELIKLMIDIDNSMPKREQLGIDFIIKFLEEYGDDYSY